MKKFKFNHINFASINSIESKVNRGIHMSHINNFSDAEMLEFLISNDRIIVSDVLNDMKKEKIKKVIDIHPYKIYQAKDGRWKTHVSDPGKTEKRRVIVKTKEDDLYDALYKHYFRSVEKNATIKDLYPNWLEYKKLKGAASTYITRINSDWKKYYINDPVINIPIRNFDKITLEEWALKLIQNNEMTKKNYINASVILRQVLLYAVDLHIIDCSPFQNVHIDGRRVFRKVKKKPSHTQIFSHDEYEKILEFAWNDFHNRTKIYVLSPLALIFQFQTGMRIGEICTLRYDDIEIPDEIHVQRMIRRDENLVVDHTKTDAGDRNIILSDDAKMIIRACREYQNEIGVDSDGYIFSINGKPLTERSIADLYRKYCKWLGIDQKSSHKARKTYISTLLDNNVNINTVREMVGHTDEHTTLANYCFDRNTDQRKKELITMALRDL